MAAKLGDVIISFTGQFAGINAGLTKLGKDVDSAFGQIQKQFEGLNSAAELLQGGFAGLAGALGVGAIAEFISSTTEMVANLQHSADAAGVTVEQFQLLTAAGRTAGISNEQMSSGLERLTRTMGEAEAGGRKQMQAFHDLGVSYQFASGLIRPTSDVLADVATKLNAIEDPAERARIEVELFGKSGQQLDSLLKEGGDAIGELEQHARDLGLVMGDEMIASIRTLGDHLDELNTHWQVLKATLVDAVAPALEYVMDLMAGVIQTAAAHSTEGAKLQHQIEQTNEAIKNNELALKNDLQALNDPTFLQDLLMWGDRKAAVDADTAALEANRKKLKELQDQQASATRQFIVVPTEGLAPPAAPPALGHPKQEEDRTRQHLELAKAIDAETKSLERQIAALTEDSRQAFIDNELLKAGTTLRTDAGETIAQEAGALWDAQEAKKENAKLDQEAKKLLEEIQTPHDKYIAALKEDRILYDSNRISLEQYNAAIKEQTDAYAKADPELSKQAELQKQFADSVENAAGAIGDDFVKALMDSQNAADRWRAFLQAAIKDVMSAFNDLVKNLIKIGFNTLFGALGLSPEGGGGAIIGPLAGSPVVQAAGGGHLDIGDWAIVGEAGPELMYADTPGTIIDAGRTRGIFSGEGNGGNTAYIDARGADVEAVARLEAGLRSLHYSIEHRAVAAVSAQRKRGGGFAATFAR